MSSSQPPDLPEPKDFPVVFEADLGQIPLLTRGLVRDVFDLGEHVLLVATDRLSAFDAVLASPIPLKGHVLTRMAEFWFDQTRHILPNHFVTTDLGEMARLGHDLSAFAEQLEGRSMLVRKAEVFPVECVVRGHLYGSGWKEYRQKGSICGLALRRGLRLGSRLEPPLFTPATRPPNAAHDENITFERAVELVGRDTAEKMRQVSLDTYQFAVAYARERGIIIADSKFEFGLVDGELMLIDEILTPDSSRFWPADSYTPGKHQLAFDKQFVRDYLEASGWDKSPPGPELPEKVIRKTAEKYYAAYRQLLGRDTL